MIKLYVGRTILIIPSLGALTPPCIILEHHRLDDANDPSIKWLEWLEGSLVWEVRSLFLVAVGVPISFVYAPVGLAIGGLGVFVVIVMVRSMYECLDYLGIVGCG